jgi:hypothetical protein
VFHRLAVGKAAQWLLSAEHIHSFTYTPDAARGTAVLGNSADAWREVWHLPTAAAPPTGRGWVEAIAAELGVAPRLQVMPAALLGLLGLVVPTLRELSVNHTASSPNRSTSSQSGSRRSISVQSGELAVGVLVQYAVVHTWRRIICQLDFGRRTGEVLGENRRTTAFSSD